tara:strand:+ start:1793 stop:2347 length:555 start_codon:yes stop_codon:yes gene_type:complete
MGILSKIFGNHKEIDSSESTFSDQGNTFTDKYLNLLDSIKVVRKKEKKNKNYKEVLILDILIYVCDAYHHLWHSINYRHGNEKAYQKQLKEWEEMSNEPQTDMYEYNRKNHGRIFNNLSKWEAMDSNLKTKIKWAKLENKQLEIYKYIAGIFDDLLVKNVSLNTTSIKELELKEIEKNLRNFLE